MKIKVFVCFLFLALTGLVCSRSVYGEEEKKEESLGLYARSAVLMDGSSGRVLYGKEELEARPMASTTKIMTCILALEYGKLTDVVEVSSYAASQPQVHLGAGAGEKFLLKDLLYSLMLESHNDTAVMIAEHMGGDVKTFASMMNQKAAEIGCEDTYFITPNGLDAVETDEKGQQRVHSTTASDLAKIMAYCTWDSPARKEFLEITQTSNYAFSNEAGTRSYHCTNHNAFLSMMQGVLSGKTGFTGEAGYSYVAALADGERQFTLALLGCGWPPHKTYKWSDARALFSYGLKHYQYQEVFGDREWKPVPVKDGVPENGKIGETAYTRLSLNLKEEEKSLRLLMKEGEKAEAVYEVAKELQAPVQAGTVVGKVRYYLGGEEVKDYPVYTMDDVEEITWFGCARQIFRIFAFAGEA